MKSMVIGNRKSLEYLCKTVHETTHHIETFFRYGLLENIGGKFCLHDNLNAQAMDCILNFRSPSLVERECCIQYNATFM